MLCAGIDGIKNEIEPGESLDVDIYDLTPEELSKIPSTPGSLEGALEALENDRAFLTEGGVFRDLLKNKLPVSCRLGAREPESAVSPENCKSLTEYLVQTWIEYKLDNEVNPMGLRPHPYEFALYYDC
jgi:glutamine synthetase